MATTKVIDNSGALFNNIMAKHKLKRDADLAEFTGMTKSYISEVRHGKREVGDQVLVRICDRTGMSLKSVKAQIAERG